jgi:hypothetical protein
VGVGGAHVTVMGEGGGVEPGPLDLAFTHADEPALQHFEITGAYRTGLRLACKPAHCDCQRYILTLAGESKTEMPVPACGTRNSVVEG